MPIATNADRLNYAIDLQTDGGAWQTVLNTSVTGKTTSGYERSHRIDLPQAGSTWTIRLRKITSDANSAKIGDTMMLQSFTEVIDAKLRYPNTALLYIEFDSSQFNGSIPQISCEPRGRVIRVPDTYDPETRTYSGTWAGTFKWAWTDNPAWIFYDLVVSDRFGLGDRLTTANIDKWTLYQVAQYCDQMVPDGKGGSGTEPRYTCNVYIQERNDAYTVLRDFAAIFRGMTYWGDDQIVALADMSRDVDFTYTHANVIDGRFTYSSSTTKNRYTNALVSWSDPDNAYSDAMEPVFEQALVARYGFNQLEITAIGCTRQSEANRKGRWGILTNNKDRVVTFNVGEDGNIPQPGYVIAVADRNLSGRDLGGRVSAVNGRILTLDRAPDASSGDRMIINLPSGVAQSRTIQSITGNKVTVTTAYSETPVTQAVWVIESDELYAQQYRVHELLVDEFEPFWRGRDVNTVTQPINLITHTGNDFSPRLLRFGSRHNVQLIHHRVTDFETNYRAGLLHRATNCGPAVSSPLVEVNLFVPLVDFDVQPPVKGHLLYRRIEDVTDLRVRRCEITLVNPRVFPHPFADAATPYPRLAGTEPGYVGFEFVLHREEARLRNVKCRADPHRLPSHPLR